MVFVNKELLEVVQWWFEDNFLHLTEVDPECALDLFNLIDEEGYEVVKKRRS